MRIVWGCALLKPLGLFLTTTGFLALIALSFPTLVIIGLLLILPGLILALAPTAFMWGCFYALAYLLLRIVLPLRFAAIAAIPIALGGLWAIPQLFQPATKATLARYHLTDVTPKTLVRLKGDIRIDTPLTQVDTVNRSNPGQIFHACDTRCIALLFEPGVRSVTMLHSADPSFTDIRDGKEQLDDAARTFRLRPKAQCANEGLDPNLKGQSAHFGRNMADNKAMADEWNDKFMSDYCLIGESPINHYDILLRIASWRPERSSASSRPPLASREDEADAAFNEIRGSGGIILFRRFRVRARTLSAPLFITATGSMESFHFEWATRFVPAVRPIGSDDLAKEIDGFLDVKRTPL